MNEDFPFGILDEDVGDAIQPSILCDQCVQLQDFFPMINPAAASLRLVAMTEAC